MRALKIVLYILLTLTAINGTVLLVGRSTPYTNPLIADGFAWCSDKPCFQQIVPGRTTWEEIMDLINVDMRSITRIIGRVADLTVEVYHSPSSPTLHAPSSVTVSWLWRQTRTVRLRDFVLLYGPPCTVELWQGRNYMVVFPSMVVMAEIIRGRVHLYSVVQAVTMIAPRDGHSCADHALRERSWSGFRHLTLYRN